jgi:hypothetical protein
MHFRSTYAFWIIILVVTGLIFFAIWLIRVNPPPSASEAEVAKPVWTEGVVQSGIARIEAGKTLSFPLNLNQRRFLSVFFRTDSRNQKISARVFAGSDFDLWKNNTDVKPFITTNPVSRGNIRRQIEAGKYVVVLDNRDGTADVILDPLSITVE